MAPKLERNDVETHIVPIYEGLLQDSEPEVRSEALAKVPHLGENCRREPIVEKIIPIISTSIVNDSSQHVKGSLADTICKLCPLIGPEDTVQLLVPSVN